jgi:hypothetical protein
MPTTPSPRYTCIDVRAATQSLTKTYDLAAAHSGITVTQFSPLHDIRTLGSVNRNQLAAEDVLSKIIHMTIKGSNTDRKAASLRFEI